MKFKLVTLKKDNNYILFFPEIDPNDLFIGEDKEVLRLKAITYTRLKLKKMKYAPKSKSEKEIQNIIDNIKEEDISAVFGQFKN